MKPGERWLPALVVTAAGIGVSVLSHRQVDRTLLLYGLAIRSIAEPHVHLQIASAGAQPPDDPAYRLDRPTEALIWLRPVARTRGAV